MTSTPLEILREDLGDWLSDEDESHDGRCDGNLIERCRSLHIEDPDTLVIPNRAPYIEAGDGSGVWVCAMVWVPSPEPDHGGHG